MLLSKSETIQLLENGGVLTKKFQRMYGVYYYITFQGQNIHNVKKNVCGQLIKELKFIKTIVSANENKFRLKVS